MTEEQRQELIKLGINPDTGRKVRSDKGQVRGAYSKTRSDKGITRGPQDNPLSAKGKCRADAGQYRSKTKGVSASKFTVYSSLRGRLLRQEADDTQPDYVVREDKNHIYTVMVRHNTARYKNYTVVNRSVKKTRTVKHIQGYRTDLEAYRWAALYELNQENAGHKAAGYPIVDVFRHEAEVLRVDNTYDLMCRLYHIADRDQVFWTYEQWARAYRVVQDELLSEDFVFELGKIPGKDGYLLEFAENLQAIEAAEKQAAGELWSARIERARVRDMQEEKRIQEEVLKLLEDPEAAGYSMSKLRKIARLRIRVQELKEGDKDD